MELELGGIFLTNDSFDYGDYEYKEECETDAAAVFLPFLCALALIIGLPGLVLLLTLLVRKRRHWSVMDIFALHLALANGLLLATLPFWAAQAGRPSGWTFGSPFCKMSGAVFNINFYCGIFLLACISLDRYLSVFCSTRFLSRRKPWTVQACCLSAWLLSLLLSIPDWVFLGAVEAVGPGAVGRAECVHRYPSPARRLASRLLHHVGGFLLPAAVLVFCFSRFLLRLWRGPRLEPRKRRALGLLLCLVGLFLLCWTPYSLTLMAHTVRGAEQGSESADSVGGGGGGGVIACGKPTSALGKGLLLMFALGCFHAGLQPLLYFGLCPNVRRAVLEMLRCVPPAEKADSSRTLWEFGLEEEEPLPRQNPGEVVPLNQNRNQDPEEEEEEEEEEEAEQSQTGATEQRNQEQEVPLYQNREEVVPLNQNLEEASALTQVRAMEQQDPPANADEYEEDGRP